MFEVAVFSAIVIVSMVRISTLTNINARLPNPCAIEIWRRKFSVRGESKVEK